MRDRSIWSDPSGQWWLEGPRWDHPCRGWGSHRAVARHGSIRVLRTSDTKIPLSPTETRLLLYLAQRPGRTISHRELLSEVWGYHKAVESRTVYATINRLRQKSERDPASPEHLVAISGVGYRFVPLTRSA